ncbi:unnamed protein product [Nippostrongylus brasiliensis]|uniref:TPR_REGION domain-containing protein n=1 Tax=Nippostrongylus brasiliensis TaxID=27835 RepID=A0A0N4YDV5_NIPBR|nr:unnamed protein product [Nippostrongylus brasiliensis]
MVKLKAKLLLCMILLNDVFCVHYWKISDDKKRIEAVPDSPYTLAYPGSLVDFLRQVDSVKKFGKTYIELNNVLKSINAREARDDPEIEKKLQAESEHCKMAGSESNQRNVDARIPDSDYADILKGYFPQAKKLVSTSSPRYGAIIARLLSHQFENISNHPYLHLAAAAYWRQNGDLQEALTCYKTAVTYA